MQLFNADTTILSKKKILPQKTRKNHPQKMLMIGSKVIFQYWPSCPNSPKTEILYHPIPRNAGLGILDWEYKSITQGHTSSHKKCNIFCKFDFLHPPMNTSVPAQYFITSGSYPFFSKVDK
jgi:hypothetical protein